MILSQDMAFNDSFNVVYYLFLPVPVCSHRPEMAYMPRDMISLPALKQTMGNKAVERRKRTQILQKARLRREVLQ